MSEMKPQNTEQRSSKKEVLKLTTFTALITASLLIAFETVVNWYEFNLGLTQEILLILVTACIAAYACGMSYKSYLQKQKIKIGY